ncbi:MAG: hypothetical protein RLZZ628_4069 [Bacteroidota bacterium]|jgi:hypothetical protein
MKIKIKIKGMRTPKIDPELLDAVGEKISDTLQNCDTDLYPYELGKTLFMIPTKIAFHISNLEDEIARLNKQPA